MLTFQDFEKSTEPVGQFIRKAIDEHLTDPMVKVAQMANNYDRQLNDTIMNYSRYLYTMNGREVEDLTASNNRIASNFFRRLNVQRNTYLLGNGIYFTDESTKEKLGSSFDSVIKRSGYNALIHGLTFGFWNVDRLYNFPLTEFKPLWDEFDSTLRAGIRFWQLDSKKPLNAVLYEEDGYTKFVEDNAKNLVPEEKKPYIQVIAHTDFGGDVVADFYNYSRLPIIPFWGSYAHQSTLVGMRAKIDSYDLISSGFANDLDDCAEIYWILTGASGMDDADMQEFRDRLKLTHIAKADRDQQVTPYTQDIPYTARKEFLDMIRAGIYEDFGGLDVHTIAAGATNDHIDAAYQALDEEADEFEYQCTEFIKQILELIGVQDEPQYKRNRISNQLEQVQMLMMEAPYLDEETMLSKLPNVSVDEVADILRRKDGEDMNRFMNTNKDPDQVEEDE